MEGLTVTLFDLTGRKAFVTGASRGIGQAIAVALAEAGADLALVSRGDIDEPPRIANDCIREEAAIGKDGEGGPQNCPVGGELLRGLRGF